MNAYNGDKYDLLRKAIDKLPRQYFCCLPTPLIWGSRLTIVYRGVNIYFKRDDLTGIGIGGNKNRKLEFIMADAIEKDATDIITQGATQTNHGCQTSGIASRYRLTCHLLLENRRMNFDEEYLKSGNIFLSKLLNTKLYHYDAKTDMNHEMEKLADKLRAKGKHPYIIPGGASNARGAVGYVNCALELIDQANNKAIKIHSIVTATGSSGTQAGLATGLKIIGSDIKVLGIGTNAKEEKQREKVYKLSKRIYSFLDFKCDLHKDEILVNCDYIGTGYGNTTEKCIEAIKTVSQLEGIYLDPIYTGIAMSGLFDLIKKGKYQKGDNIIFLHTGGQPALWAYKKFFQ